MEGSTAAKEKHPDLAGDKHAGRRGSPALSTEFVTNGAVLILVVVPVVGGRGPGVVAADTVRQLAPG